MKGGRSFLQASPHPLLALSCTPRVGIRRRGAHEIQPNCFRFPLRTSSLRDECVPNNQYCRFFASTTSVPSAAEESLACSSKQLLSAAYNEARRLLEVHTDADAAAQQTQQDAVAAAVKQDSERCILKNDANHVFKAAHSLLLVSKDHALLKMAISTADVRFRRHVDVLHKAFLSLTSKCLDQASSNDSTAIQLALQLAERAGQIGLPIHTPLHIQIIEAAVTFRAGDIPLLLHSGSIRIHSSPEAFAAAVQSLIRKEHFSVAQTVLEEMPIYLTRSGVKDVFVAIREAYANADFAVRRVSILCRLVQQLELSIQKLIIQDHKNQLQSDSHVVVTSAAGDSDSHESMDELIDAIVEYSRSNGMDHDSAEDNDADDSDEDSTLELIHTSDDDGSSPTIVNLKDMRDDAMDHAAMSVLLSRVEDSRVWRFLAELMGCSYRKLTRGMMRADRERTLDDFLDSSKSLTSHTWQEAPWKFPDITDQLIRLNGGADLEFSNEYEDILLEEESRLNGNASDDGDDDEEDSDYADDYGSDDDDE